MDPHQVKVKESFLSPPVLCTTSDQRIPRHHILDRKAVEDLLGSRERPTFRIHEEQGAADEQVMGKQAGSGDVTVKLHALMQISQEGTCTEESNINRSTEM
jgi:hypothetical protein